MVPTRFLGGALPSRSVTTVKDPLDEGQRGETGGHVNRLNLFLDRGNRKEPFCFDMRRLINAGYTGRDQESLRRHIEELKKEGIPAPDSTPTAYEVITKLLYFDDEIEVVGEKTSGEAEFVLLCGGGDVYVGVGSDHTDRELEAVSIIKSKQICPNVMSNHVWDLNGVRKDWDEILLRSWVKDEQNEKILYQQASLASILTPEDLMAFVREKLDDRNLEGVVLFSGTVSIIPEKIVFSPYFEVELFNPKTEQKLSCAYQVRNLKYLRS